jgi:hypothetical protein
MYAVVRVRSLPKYPVARVCFEALVPGDAANNATVDVTGDAPAEPFVNVTLLLPGDVPAEEAVLMCACMIRSPVLHVVYWLIICR